MSPENLIGSIFSVEKVMIESHGKESDAVDVIVRMEDGAIYTAMFVTLDYLKRQMQLTYEMTQFVDDTVPVRFAALDTPHILVEALNRDTLEDTIDNLLALETFEGLFTRVTEDPEEAETETSTTNGSGHRATQEVAAVVLEEVLVVNDD